MNRNFIKYAPLAAEAFMSIYERISNKKNGKQKEAELHNLLAENMAALTNQNKRLKKQIRKLQFFTAGSFIIAALALILHWV